MPQAAPPSQVALLPFLSRSSNPTLLYSGAWFTAGNASSEFNGTTHGTNTAGSTMTDACGTAGTAVSVFGTVDPTSSSSNYTLDNLPIFTHAVNASSALLPQQLFYQSPSLVDGEHTLVVQKATQDNGTVLLDYLEVTTNVPASESASEKAARAGATAAGVIGAIAFVAAAVLAFLLIRRRRREKAAEPGLDLLANAEKGMLPPTMSTEVKSDPDLFHGVPIIREPRPPPQAYTIPRIAPPSLSGSDHSIAAVLARRAPSGIPAVTGSDTSSRTSSIRDLRTVQISLPNSFGGAGQRRPPTEAQLRPGVRQPFPVRPRRGVRFIVANGIATPSSISEPTSEEEGSGVPDPRERSTLEDGLSPRNVESDTTAPAQERASPANPSLRISLGNLVPRSLIQKPVSQRNTLGPLPRPSQSYLHTADAQVRPKSQGRLPPFPVRPTRPCRHVIAMSVVSPSEVSDISLPNPHGGPDSPYEVTEAEIAHWRGSMQLAATGVPEASYPWRNSGGMRFAPTGIPERNRTSTLNGS